MDISVLMIHPAAGQFAAAIPASADVKALADKYGALITHGDYASHCQALGIEFHIRTAAQVAFNNYRVLEALDSVEKALEGRKRAHKRILREGGR